MRKILETKTLCFWPTIFVNFYNQIKTNQIKFFPRKQIKSKKLFLIKINQIKRKYVFKKILEEGKKEALEHWKHLVKICLNRGHIFQNNLRNTWTVILKMSKNCLQITWHLLCNAKYKNKIKIYDQKAIQYAVY